MRTPFNYPGVFPAGPRRGKHATERTPFTTLIVLLEVKEPIIVSVHRIESPPSVLESLRLAKPPRNTMLDRFDRTFSNDFRGVSSARHRSTNRGQHCLRFDDTSRDRCFSSITYRQRWFDNRVQVSMTRRTELKRSVDVSRRIANTLAGHPWNLRCRSCSRVPCENKQTQFRRSTEMAITQGD